MSSRVSRPLPVHRLSSLAEALRHLATLLVGEGARHQKTVALTVRCLHIFRDHAEFTGISAPYEAPEKPEVHVKTDESSIEDGVKIIIDYLTKENLI